jgi:hypothetical protein
MRMRTFTGKSNTLLHTSTTHTFPDPLSSYKQKDNLIALLGALSLKASSIITELSAQLRAHLATHPDIQYNPRFSRLFLTCWCHVENTLILDD